MMIDNSHSSDTSPLGVGLFIVIVSWIALLLLPGVVSFAAGFILVVSCMALLLYAIGAFISFISSTTLSVLGWLCSVLLFCAAAVLIAMVFPVLLVVAAFAVVLISGFIFSVFLRLV